MMVPTVNRNSPVVRLATMLVMIVIALTVGAQIASANQCGAGICERKCFPRGGQWQ